MEEPENTQFEPLMEKLRTVIETIESDQGDLESSLKAYENGIQLVRLAQKYLAQAEQRVTVLGTDSDHTDIEPE